jgi:hypothetical protein
MNEQITTGFGALLDEMTITIDLDFSSLSNALA